MVCPACIKHVDNSILPFIGRMMARGLIFLGGGGDKILAATFDAVRRGINPGNDFVRHRITCYVSQQRLSAGVTRQQHNADKRFGLMEAGFNGINVALGGSALPRWSQKSTCYNRMRMGECTEKDIHTGAK